MAAQRGSPRAASYFHISDNLYIKFDNNDKKRNLGNQWQSLISSQDFLLTKLEDAPKLNCLQSLTLENFSSQINFYREKSSVLDSRERKQFFSSKSNINQDEVG